ncbi:MAG: hypothetical protein GWQ05_28640 [Verrucomicrobiaceae bacterium]|nr:hypothetical protein [Verrucomicrobiaceae bacterium]
MKLNHIHYMRNPDTLSRRDRQIMDVLLQLGTGSARDIREKLPDRPTYSAARKLLSVLKEKGQVKHRQEGKSYIYSSAKPRAKMAENALKRLRDTFFGGVDRASRFRPAQSQGHGTRSCRTRPHCQSYRRRQGDSRS